MWPSFNKDVYWKETSEFTNLPCKIHIVSHMACKEQGNQLGLFQNDNCNHLWVNLWKPTQTLTYSKIKYLIIKWIIFCMC